MPMVLWGPQNRERFTAANSHSYYVIILFQVTPGLPKTRSGKIMRRILRKVAENKHNELGDISTLADPPIVATIVDKHKQKYGM